MGLLDFLRPMKVYTAAEVHAEITAKVAMLMEEMKKQVEAVSLPVEIQSELELLRTTGLINSRNMQALADAENHVNRTNEERKMTAERILLSLLAAWVFCGCTSTEQLLKEQDKASSWTGKVEFAPDYARGKGPCFVLYTRRVGPQARLAGSHLSGRGSRMFNNNPILYWRDWRAFLFETPV